MASQRSPSGPDPGFASRLPWLLIAVFALGLVIAGVVAFVNRSSGTTVTVNAPAAAASPTAVVVVVRSATPLPTPTATETAVPARPTSTLAPTPASTPASTPAFTPAPPVVVTAAPPATPSAPPAAAAPPPPTDAPTTAATALPTTPPATLPAASATPTPFAGEVADPGGLGNTRANLDAAYGPPTGETPSHLVVYKKGTLEYHVAFTASQPRALLVAEIPPPNAPLTQDAATAAARKLFPHDAQPRAQQPEGNNAFTVERFTSPLLGQAIPSSETHAGQPGDFLAVYAKDGQGRVNRVVVGAGDDPTALLNR